MRLVHLSVGEVLNTLLDETHQNKQVCKVISLKNSN